jgi:hypothetical protein
MPLTQLYIASVTMTDSKGWENEGNLNGPPDEANAVFTANGFEESTLLLSFDAGSLPVSAVIGEVTVSLVGSWTGTGSPSPVVLQIGTAPPLEFVPSGSPEELLNSDPSGWGMNAAALNALEGTLTITTSGVETFSLDAITVTVNWTPGMPVVRRALLGGILGGGALVGFAGL